jgi:hypothetical protein
MYGRSFELREVRLAILIASATALVVATAGTVGAIVSGSGVPGFPPYSLGYLDLIVWVTMVPTAMVAAPFGVRLGHELNKTRLNRLLIELLFVVGVDMTIKGFSMNDDPEPPIEEYHRAHRRARISETMVTHVWSGNNRIR